eukprot:465623-Rhodomonas_salina.2
MSRRARHTLTCTADEQRTGQRLHSTQEPRNPDGTCRLQQQETFFMMQLRLFPRTGSAYCAIKFKQPHFPGTLSQTFPAKTNILQQTACCHELD